MKLISKLIKFELQNSIRSKWIIVYSLIFFVLTFLLFSFETDSAKASLTLTNLILIVIPLVSIIFGVMFVYNSIEYVQLVLCQPIDRKSLFIGLYLGNTFPLIFGFVLSIILGTLFSGILLSSLKPILITLLIGIFLTLIFTAISFWIGFRIIDKAKGLGTAIILWFSFAVLYDGILLFIIYSFREYPIENFALAACLINPIDLARIFFILDFNIAALMGYTGAVFNKFFGSSLGIIVSFSMLVVWFIIPFLFGMRRFLKKDF